MPVAMPATLPSGHTAFMTMVHGKLHYPNVYEDLHAGIAWIPIWAADPWCSQITKDALVAWLALANHLLGYVASSVPVAVFSSPSGVSGSCSDDPPVTMKSANGKLPPMNCIVCNHRNEYVGQEHLDTFGEYTCRSCRKVTK